MTDHGELAMRIEVYDDGYTILEIKDKKLEGVSSGIKRWLAMFFLGLGMIFVRAAIKLHPDATRFLMENLIEPLSDLR